MPKSAFPRDLCHFGLSAADTINDALTLFQVHSAPRVGRDLCAGERLGREKRGKRIVGGDSVTAMSAIAEHARVSPQFSFSKSAPSAKPRALAVDM